MVYRFDDATTDRRMYRARLYAAAVTILASALFATAAVAEKLQADAEPVRDILLVVFMGDLSNPPGSANLTPASVFAYRTRFKDALEKRLPAIFDANGVPPRGVMVRTAVLKPGVRPPDAMLNDRRFSHILVLNLKEYRYLSRRGVRQLVVYINFDGELWSTERKSIVAKYAPSLAFVEKQPMLQTQDMAGQILNALHTDGLIVLKQGHALDFSGEKIGEVPIDTPDR
jgi:hypothetical protein